MMTLVREHHSPSGTWLTIDDDAGTSLKAFVPLGDGSDIGVTVFWPARSAPHVLVRFFQSSAPKVRDGESIYAHTRLAAYDRYTGEFHTLNGRLDSVTMFDRFDFIRMERLDYGRTNADRTGALDPSDVRSEYEGGSRAIFVVWANLDAGAEKDVPLDAAGVLLMARHLPALTKEISEVIALTSAQDVDLISVLNLVERLRDYLYPDATPLAMSA
jgi:hypothetical protein